MTDPQARLALTQTVNAHGTMNATMPETIRLLALDPAATTGFAWSDGTRREYGIWDLTGGAGEHPGARIDRLICFVADIAKAWGVDKIAYEDAGFGSRNPAVQAMHNELRGAIKYVAHRLCVPCVGFHPTTIKTMAGSGRADKQQMIRAARTLLGVETASADVADALFILELAKQDHKRQEAVRRARPSRPRRQKEKRLF